MLNRPVLVVDFGAQYAQLIARRIREAQVYSEIVPNSMTADEMLAKEPTAIILSGGPASVLEDGAPSVDPKIFEVGVPVLGISYGFQAMAKALGGKVQQTAKSENRQVPVRVLTSDSALLGADGDQEVWVTHGDAVVKHLPDSRSPPNQMTLRSPRSRTRLANSTASSSVRRNQRRSSVKNRLIASCVMPPVFSPGGPDLDY